MPRGLPRFGGIFSYQRRAARSGRYYYRRGRLREYGAYTRPKTERGIRQRARLRSGLPRGARLNLGGIFAYQRKSKGQRGRYYYRDGTLREYGTRKKYARKPLTRAQKDRKNLLAKARRGTLMYRR